MDKVAFVRAVDVEFDLFRSRSIQQNLADFFRQIGKRRMDVEIVVPRQRVQQVKVVKRTAVGPGSDGAFAQRKARIGHHQIRREVHPRPQTVAFGAGAVGIVE